MGRILDTSKYPIKENPVSDDIVIGSDSQNNDKTVNFRVSTLSGEASNINQDNKPKVVNYGFAAFNGFELSVSNTINNLDPFTVAFDEILYLEGVVFPADKSPVSYRRVFVLEGLGKGDYGRGGIQIQESDLKMIENEQIGEFPTFIINNPNAIVDDRGEVGATPIEDVVNNGSIIDVNEGQVWFFDTLVNGSRVLYGFSGNTGVYGTTGTSTANSDDFFIVFQESYATIINNTSDLENNGEDGVNPFITVNDLPSPITNTSELTNDGGDGANPYVQSDEIQGLQEINEGNGIGWRLIGRNASVYGDIGLNAVDFSVQTSGNNGATGQGAFALGLSAISSAQYTFVAGGNGNQATSNFAFVQGISSRATNVAASAFNNSTRATGNSSFAANNGSVSSGTDSATFNGTFNATNTTSGRSSFTIGIGNTNPSYSAFNGGTFGTNYTPVSSTSRQDSDRLFNVGNGIDDSNRADAFTILNNGNIGLGINNFEANDNGIKLQINGGISTTEKINGLIITDLSSFNVNNIGIGNLAGNSQDNTIGIGNQAIRNSTGIQVVALGTFAGVNSAGNDCVFIGHGTGQNSTGEDNTFVGSQAGAFSSLGDRRTAIGYQAGRTIDGNDVNVFGYRAGRNQKGSNNNGVGSDVLEDNLGNNNNAVGNLSLQENLGDDNNVVGHNSLEFNQGDNNNVLGSNSFNNRIEDTPNAKLVESIDTVNNTLTITNHNFGSIGERIYLTASTTGTFPTGISTAWIDYIVIDANTLEVQLNLTDTGTGDLTLIPQEVYSNSVAIGNNVEPTKSNQVVLGDSNIEEVKTEGVYVSGEYTVATLPSNPSSSSRGFVTDATTTNFYDVVTGGGANYVPVFYDGTNWRIG